MYLDGTGTISRNYAKFVFFEFCMLVCYGAIPPSLAACSITMPCKAKRQYLLIQVRRYCLLALQSRLGQSALTSPAHRINLSSFTLSGVMPIHNFQHYNKCDDHSQQTRNICMPFIQWWTNIEGRRCINVMQMFGVCWAATTICDSTKLVFVI